MRRFEKDLRQVADAIYLGKLHLQLRSTIIISARLTFVYTNIGRGHPFYLDGIIEALIRKRSLTLLRRQTDVFELSRGLPLLAWNLVRLAYRVGASDGPAGKLYARIRSGADYNKPSLTLNLLGKGIRQALMDQPDIVVVAHPTLAAILRDRKGLVYQHGELAVPQEAVVRGAECVMVPTDEAAKPFLQSGYEPHQIIVTGLCVEPALVRQAEDAFEQRLLRINGQGPLTGAFFSSGAEPAAHIRKLVAAAGYAVAAGGKAVLFVRSEGAYLRQATAALQRWQVGYTVIDSSDYIPAETPSVMIVKYGNRRELDIFTERLFPRFDYYVAPPHERTNWGMGLGLPTLVVGPFYGPFAPMNARILLDAGVGRIVDEVDPSEFGRLLSELRQEGHLGEMCRNGFKQYRINGFEAAADFFINYCR